MSSRGSGIARKIRSAAARVPEPRTAHRVLRRLTYPLLPDDYSQMFHPLWSSRELRGEIISVRREADDAVTLVIKPGWGSRPTYEPGQYLGIGVLLDGRWTWRSYSLTSTPHENTAAQEYSVTVKALPEGKLSSHIVGTVRPGTIVRLAAPAGDFTLTRPLPEKILFVTAGSGITPVMGMLRYLDRQSGVDGFPLVHHVHSVRTEDDALFADELRALEKLQDGYTFDLQVTSRDGRFRPGDLGTRVPDWRERTAWACGPQEMLDGLQQEFDGAGIGDALHTESFTIDRKSDASGGTVRFGSAGASVEVDGATTLLEAGEANGIQMPFGCRMGICQTCVLSLEDGWVRDLRSGSEHGPGERINTCVSVACGDVELKM